MRSQKAGPLHQPAREPKDLAALAGILDSRLQYAHFPYLRERLSRMAAEAAPGMPVRVLDAGCGPGNLGFFCRAVRNLSWIGVDLWAEKLQEARETAAYNDLIQANLLDGVPIRRGSVDVVICNEVLMYMPHSRALLGRFRWALAPGGRLFVYNPICRAPRLLERLKGLARRLRRNAEAVSWDAPGDWRRAKRATRIAYFSFDSLQDEIRQAGFIVDGAVAFRLWRNRIRLLKRWEASEGYRQGVMDLSARFPRWAADLMVAAIRGPDGG